MIDQESSLFEITEEFPETIPVFVSNGFSQMDNSEKRATIGKSISLTAAASVKKLNLDAFILLLEEAITQHSNSADVTLSQNKLIPDHASDIHVVGVLPCPVRIPLMEKWNHFLTTCKNNGMPAITHELKAASMGLEWVQNNINDIDDADALPDLFLSAGFDMFFDKQRFGRFRRNGVFTDLTGVDKYHSDFKNIALKDPQNFYSIIAVVPALFLVNTEELDGRDTPKSWEDILDPRFENSVSLPVSDFDLFNAILLNIHKVYGDRGVQALGRSLLESLHPAEMVKSEQKKSNKPSVTIMPYFFSKMVKPGGTLTAVWPEDGAILSPIFMLAKTAKSHQLKNVVDFFASQEVGELLAGQGLFPSTHPDVSNTIPEQSRFMWLGWDYIEQNDLSERIKYCETLFNEAANMSNKTCCGECRK